MRFATDRERGLHPAEVSDRLQKHGLNRLPQSRKRSPFARFLSQFNNILIYILLAAGATKLVLSLWIDACIIFSVVLMVLADDNFASITAAVKEGRTVYNNIEKALLFILPTNVAEALVIAVAIIFGFTMPFTASHVLWINMVTSVTLGLVISFEPHETDVMRRPPRATDRQIVTGFGIWRIIFVGLTLLAYTLVAFFWIKSQGASDALARTVSVNAIAIGQVFYLLNSRYLLDSSLSLKAHAGNKYLPLSIVAIVVLQFCFTYTRPFQVVFGNETIPLRVWPWLFAGSLVFFLVVETEKLIIRWSGSLRRTITAAEAGT